MEQPQQIADTPCPAVQSVFTASDGTRLAVHDWPLAQAARATVLIVHGLGEHAGRHAALARRLNAWGYAVRGYDHFGHGQSDGPRGALTSDTRLLDDLAALVDATRARQPAGQPLILLGHSMGGLVAARFVSGALEQASWSRPVDGLVLSSPALDPGLSALQRGLLALSLPLTPHLAVGNGLKPDWISRSAAVVQAYVADPLVHDRITAMLAGFIAREGRTVLALAPRWTTPTLLLWAGADRCVAPAGAAAFATAAPGVQAQCFAGLAHEIFNEPEREQVLARLRAWLSPQS